MKFESFNFKPEILDVIEKIGFSEPTPIQEIVIPKLLKKYDVIGRSQTGSGKTHSFLLPIINNLDFDKGLQAIIISPTRDLALQIYNFLKEIKKYLPELNIKLFTSGIDVSKNISNLQNNNSHIVVSTPGRLKSIFKSNNFNYDSIETLILDEADMLTETGFFKDIEDFLLKCNNANIGVFSATINQAVEIFLKKFFRPDYVLDVDENIIPKNINNYLINTKHIDKFEAVESFINAINPYLLMIFCNTKEEVKKLYLHLKEHKYSCTMLSGDMSPRERKSVIKRIKNDEFRIIVCSDIAARGVDIENVTEVLSTGFPNNMEYYLHRCGRTGRIGKNGNSYLFYDNDHLDVVEKINALNIEYEYLKITNNQLVIDKNPIYTRKTTKKNLNQELSTQIKIIKNKNKSKVVKPGYKKKVTIEIEKEKKRYRRKKIKEDIRKQRVERYKQNAREK